MDVVLTGTGSPIPDPNRAGPSTLVKVAELEHILIDAGRGVVMRMAGAGSMPPFLSGVLITHLHSDHLTDLNDVITTHWVMNQGPATLKIFGPPGIAHFVDHMLAALEPDIGYRIAHHDGLQHRPDVDVTEVEPGDAFELGSASISVFETVHAPVHPTIGFRIEHDGKVAALAGDTIPCAGLDALVTDADVYVQTVIRDDIVKMVPNERLQDILDYHSSVEQAGQTAARNGVKCLMLTHLVPAPQPEQYDEWKAIAAAHFDGEIVIGDDLTTVTI